MHTFFLQHFCAISSLCKMLSEHNVFPLGGSPWGLLTATLLFLLCTSMIHTHHTCVPHTLAWGASWEECFKLMLAEKSPCIFLVQVLAQFDKENSLWKLHTHTHSEREDVVFTLE